MFLQQATALFLLSLSRIEGNVGKQSVAEGLLAGDGDGVGIMGKARCRQPGYDCPKSPERIKSERRIMRDAGCDKVMLCRFDTLTDTEIRNESWRLR
jgi:hypothetical protein